MESDANPMDADRWRAVIAAARLSEGLPKRQEKDVVKIVREGIDS